MKQFHEFLLEVIPLISNANFILCQLVTSNCLVKESLDCPGDHTVSEYL